MERTKQAFIKINEHIDTISHDRHKNTFAVGESANI